jgi:hypothetical protein
MVMDGPTTGETASIWYRCLSDLSGTAQIEGDKKNGKGTLLITPNDQHVGVRRLSNQLEVHTPRFVELPDVVSGLDDGSSILLEGAPGAGKSNVCQDIEKVALLAGIPLLRVSVHINAGTMRHVEDNADIFERFLGMSGPKLFVVDNADYPGYRGRSRTHTSASAYTKTVVPLLIEVIQGDNVAALGTSHDERWRRNKWGWGDDVETAAQELLESFEDRKTFSGQMTERSVAELMIQRGATSRQAETARAILSGRSVCSFYFANHVSIELLETDPESAINQVESGRRDRYGD